MKLLIIGKNGQVGSKLIHCAIENNIQYIATDREALDISKPEFIVPFFEKNHDFNFVINAAAYTNVDAAEKEIESANLVNNLAVQYLAQSCKKYNIPLIHLSTDYIFDGEKLTGYHEDDIPNPKNTYGQTKLNGENNLRKTWEKHIILRVSWVFSEYGKNFVKTIASLSEKKDSFSVVCDQFGSPTSAQSIAEAIIHICKTLHTQSDLKKYWGVYHFADFPITNWQQLAEHVVRIKHPHKNIEIFPIESKDYPTLATRPKNSMLQTQKIKKTFNIDPKFWMNEVERIIKIL